jgi:hypothetical protein
MNKIQNILDCQARAANANPNQISFGVQSPCSVTVLLRESITCCAHGRNTRPQNSPHHPMSAPRNQLFFLK